MANADTTRMVTMDVNSQPDRYAVHIQVNRPVYTQQDFNQKYTNNESSAEDPESTDKKQLSKEILYGLRHQIEARCLPSADCAKKSLLSFLPFIRIMHSYNVRTDLPSDIMSGLIVGVMHIPQGMAYGMLTKLDPVYGLYASFFPVICYFFFGTSKHISIGTFAVVSLMIGKVVEQSDCVDLESQTQSNGTFNSGNYSMTADNLSTTEAPFGGGLSDYQKCQIGVAMSVSFMVGLFQVSYCTFIFHLLVLFLIY
jgi:hypothetical protein